MSRVEIAEANDIPSRVRRAIAAIRQLKNRQFIGGDSVVFYQKDTGNTYDWSGTLPPSPQAANSALKALRVTAIAKRQNVLFGDLIAELYVNNMNARHTVIDYINEINNNLTYFSIQSERMPVTPSQTNRAVWNVYIGAGDPTGSGRPTNTCFMKAYVIANDDVTVTVESIN